MDNHQHCHSGHDHSHHDHLAHDRRLGILWKVLIITSLYLIAEVVGGIMTGSLALLADAGHMFADAAAIGLALFAAWFAEYPASSQKTFGYYRLEILVALFNGVLLAVISIGIIYEAIQRWQDPPEVAGGWMLAVAAGGLVVNLVSVSLLHGKHDGDLNLKGAYLHVLGDLLGSVGAILAAVLIVFLDFTLADSLISIIIALLVMFSAVKLVLEAVNVLLEGSPSHINVAQLKQEMLGLCGVISVHDLHVWTITSGKDAIAAHVVVEKDAFTAETLQCIQRCLKEKFGVSHATLQLEPPDFEEDEVHF